MMGRAIGICHNFPCDTTLPAEYYRVIRVIRNGNKRRSFNFCSVRCMKVYFEKMVSE